jgi:NAD(P) transhydrogenase subunit beta
MNIWLDLLIDLIIILIFIGGFRQFRFPKGARRGNMTAAFALALAVAVVILRHKILEPELVIIALVLGSALGWAIAMRVNMIQIPAMVAFQHGAGGIAAFLVSFVELTRNASPGLTVDKVSGLLGLVIGAATFSGSMIASGKLANVIKQPPILLPKHSWLVIGLIILIALSGFVTGNAQDQALIYNLLLLLALSVLLGLVFSIRIGGADMPVLISFLNATAGLAAAFCGVIIQSRLLIACGATVAASGSILTHVMCRAMNRNLLKVFIGFQAKPAFDWTQSIAIDKEEPEKIISPIDQEAETDPLAEAIVVSKASKTIIIIPGYGMALAQAQFKVVELVNLLERLGKQVKFAIHPVAGRMPGHMNVLLAEAEVPYDKLFEMEEINPEFKETDLAIIVGASDVVNPAAISVENTPISGMPILMAHEANKVLVCNLDEKPGYSGVENPLYQQEKVIMLLGDAKDTLANLLNGIAADAEKT